MKNLTWQNPEQLFVAQVLINKVKSKCCGIKGKYKKTEWFNSGKSELELNSKMLRYAIDFLESIPEEICTHAGVDIYLTFTKVSTNQELYDYYIKFSDSFRVLTATEFMFLNKLFIQRWKAII